ncbi:uncharacterized protein [Spinacia oleracea]|uniref:Uncharacterized protein n=1 Tax=Spinacia oleracea TaxID=3562 RepID=A0ABM3RG83_SPIOL|nr:uncharacterized protein LOC130469381 [Spinacia oleracea]
MMRKNPFFFELASSINLNLATCFIKKNDFLKVGNLCSLVLCHDTKNVKAYYRRVVAAFELHKLDLAFIGLAQEIKINTNTGEFHRKLKEVISFLGWSPKFVADALAVVGEGEEFQSYSQIGLDGENGNTRERVFGKKQMDGNNRKDGKGLFKRKEKENEKVNESGRKKGREASDRCSGVLPSTVQEDHTLPGQVGRNVIDNSNVEGKVNPPPRDQRFNVEEGLFLSLGVNSRKKPNPTGPTLQFSNRKRQESYLHLTPSVYRVISSGRTLIYYCSSENKVISIRVLSPSKEVMDWNETLKDYTPMEISQPPPPSWKGKIGVRQIQAWCQQISPQD